MMHRADMMDRLQADMDGAAARQTAMPEAVAAAFAAFPAPVRARLLEVRSLILSTAAETPGVGPLSETLKWGEPAYLTEASGSATTIRLGCPKTGGRTCAVYFNCRTTLVDSFRAHFGDVFTYEGNRAILFDADEPLPKAPLAICLAMALTYHRRQR
ncbi:DUF1801 domain-containing protein [Aminobacter sp. LjRoot7]|uniref:DUF1801 domain-containing protein n=1 Tax=Aminobacter sp. LjRoot7 TaxID=3342335 RepID=UPI003F4F6D91